MSLMPETFRDGLELVGLTCAVLIAVLIAWTLQTLALLWLDRRRAIKKPLEGLSWESQPAVDTPVPAVEPVKSGSPFRRKRSEVAK